LKSKAMTESDKPRSVSLTLPYPPSVNAYWRRVGNRTVLSRAAREFRKRVWDLWFAEKYLFGRKGFGDREVRVEIEVHPPDQRKRDIDNIAKPVLDALEHAKIIDNDSQVKELSIIRLGPVPGGELKVRVVAKEGPFS